MTIINTDTNCSVGGYRVPVGTTEFPLDGTVGIITSTGYSTNVTCGSLDTLMVWSGGAAVETGPDWMAMFVLGVFLSVSVFGLAAYARRLVRVLRGSPGNAV